MSNKALTDKIAQKLQKLLKLSENKCCADCDSKQPRWASTNLGVFVCIRCSGIHRKLGTHISKVKSVSLDGWDKQTYDNFIYASGGSNSKANEYWEYSMPESRKMKESDSDYSAESFIRDKYEKKLFIPKNTKAPRANINLKTSESSQSNIIKSKPRSKVIKKSNTSPSPSSSPTYSNASNNSNIITFNDNNDNDINKMFFNNNFEQEFASFTNSNTESTFDFNSFDNAINNNSNTNKNTSSFDFLTSNTNNSSSFADMDSQISSFFVSNSNTGTNDNNFNSSNPSSKEDIMSLYKSKPKVSMRQARSAAAFGMFNTNTPPTNPLQTSHSYSGYSSQSTPPVQTSSFSANVPNNSRFAPMGMHPSPAMVSSTTTAPKKNFPMMDVLMKVNNQEKKPETTSHNTKDVFDFVSLQ